MSEPRLLPLFCVGFDGTSVPDHLLPWLAAGLGGVILFKRNLQDLGQTLRLTAGIRAAAPGPHLIGVDQEGGRVTRLPAPFLALPAGAEIGARGDAPLAHALARAVGRELRAAGITWNLAPVLDVDTNPANPVIGDRAFGSDPEAVARLGASMIRGYLEAGITCTAKHFPGHGDTSLDSHLTLPESRQTAGRWRSVEFVPFRAAIQAGVPMVMVAHLLCPGLDPACPSSLSRIVITDILRHELGFDGLVVSDDLEMSGITSRMDVGEAAVRFLEAGGDLVLICRDTERQRAALAAVEVAVRSGRLSGTQVEASLERIRRLRASLPVPSGPIDIQAVQAIVGSPAHQALREQVGMKAG